MRSTSPSRILPPTCARRPLRRRRKWRCPTAKNGACLCATGAAAAARPAAPARGTARTTALADRARGAGQSRRAPECAGAATGRTRAMLGARPASPAGGASRAAALADGESRPGKSGEPRASSSRLGNLQQQLRRACALALDSSAKKAAAAGAHPECGESARHSGSRLRHRQRRRRRNPAQRGRRKAGNSHRCAARTRKNSRPSRGNIMTRSSPALRLLGLMLIIHCPANASEPALPLENAVPGGVKIIRLDSSGPAMPYVDADGHRALVVQDGCGLGRGHRHPAVGAARARGRSSCAAPTAGRKSLSPWATSTTSASPSKWRRVRSICRARIWSA